MPTSHEWKKIWKMNVANKVKVFVWQLAHNSLQVKQDIARRGIKLDTNAPCVIDLMKMLAISFLNVRICAYVGCS
jgi:hypothetical protein